MTTFDRTTEVQLQEQDARSATFHATLDERWSSLRGMHGGYVAALTARAFEGLISDRAIRTVTVSFLRPAVIGPALITVELVRSGRSLSTAAVQVRQGDRDVAISRITAVADVAGEEWTTPVTDRPAPLAECVAFAPPPTIRHFEHAELRTDPATTARGDGGRARIAGHVCPVEERPFDAAWLVMGGDWFPPSPFRRVAPPTGGVSIDYTVHLHRTLPADRHLWLEGVFESPESVAGIALEHGTLATPDGALVAETFHTRWTG